MKQILIILGLFASVSTFAQSPRIKLNQITKDTVKGSVLISSPTDSGMVYSRDFYVAYGADTVLILYGDTLAAKSGIISSVLSDGVTITGNGTSGNELKVDTSLIATIKALNDSLATISASTTPDGVTITGDGSVGNPLKVDTLLISTIKGLNDTLTARGYLTAEVDGSITNELQTISTSGAAGNITLSDGGGTLNLNVDDADASATNEGSLTVGAGTASTSVISSNTSGSTDVTLTAGSNITLSETGNNITIAASGGGTTYNNISETADTVFIDKFLNVDTSTLYVDATNNRVAIGQTQTLSGAALSLRGGMHFVDPDTTVFDDAVVYIYPKEQTTAGANSGEFAFFLGGPGSGSSSQGPAFYLRGNNYVRNSNQKGLISFIAGAGLSSPTGLDGNIWFATNGGNMYLRYDGGLEVTNLANTTGVSANMYYNTTTDELLYITSSQRYKTNIRDYDRGINDLMKLRPVYYQPKNSTTNNNIYNTGFIAEEVESIGLTEYIDYDENGLANSIHYSLMTAILTKATQEQQAIIKTQQTEIDQLKTLITDLTNRLTILENK